MYDEPERQSLTESITLEGILSPIIGNKMENGRYMTLAGHNRYEGSKRAGFDIDNKVISEIIKAMEELLTET